MKHSSHVPIFLAGIFFLGSALIPSITSAQWFPHEGGYCKLTEDPNVNFCVFDPSLYAQFGIVPSAIGGTPPPQTGTPPPQTGTPPPQTGTPPPQTSGGGGGGRYTPSFSLEITPRNPAPQERIVAEIKSFSIDLDRATTTWYLNDNRVFFGKGRKMFFFSAGDVGKRTTIEVVVEDNRFGIVTGSVSFVPVAVDLLWEAVDSYTPPFYKGRALPGLQSAVRIIALPYLSPSKENEADPGSFVYKWKKDGQFGPFNSQSGYGRNTLLFTPSVVDDSPEIGIEISSFDKTVSGENTLALVTADPFIHIYEEGPLQGIIYERAMEDGFAMKNKDAIFVAEPYFFSAETRSAKNLSYLWEQNGAAARGGKKGVFSVSSGKGSEQFSIALSVRNVAKILQEAEKSFTASWVGETVVNNALFGNI